MKDVEFISDDLALVGGGEILVNVGEPLNLGAIKQKPVAPKIKNESGGDDVAPWGEDNDFPQQVIELAELNTEILSLIDWKSRALQGRRVLAMEEYWDDESGEWKERGINDEDIRSFLRDTTFKRYLREASFDFYAFANVFPELIKSLDGKSIAYIGTQDAMFCRFSKMDEKGAVKYCYVNANFPNAKSTDKETTSIAVIDPYDVERVKKARESTDNVFVYPISAPSPGKIYYQLAYWNGFITSGWAKIARSIPEGKERMMDKMLSATHLLQIPLNYWIAAYKDWGKLTQEEQLEIKKKKVKEINDQLTGVKNAGKTILTEVGMDIQGREIPGWKIEPIQSAVKDGANLEDSREASEHLMRAMSVDPTLVGDGPGKKMGSGSGTDKRVAYNAYLAGIHTHRDIILEPLMFIAEYNGWLDKYPGLVFRFEEVRLDTLDNGNTSKTIVN